MELIVYKESDLIFEPLQELHFELMLAWLQASHVKCWWDPDISWTLEKVRAKYVSYVQGYKRVRGQKEALDAFVIVFREEPVGYIQMYDLRKHDHSQEVQLDLLPKKLAGIDVFFGEVKVIGKGLGSFAIEQFLKNFVAKKYDACAVVVDVKKNPAGIAYSRAGFKEFQLINNGLDIFIVVNHRRSFLIMKIFT